MVRVEGGGKGFGAWDGVGGRVVDWRMVCGRSERTWPPLPSIYAAQLSPRSSVRWPGELGKMEQGRQEMAREGAAIGLTQG